MQRAARSVNQCSRLSTDGKLRANIRSPQSIAFRVEEFTQLTEDRLQFDGPRATYGRFRILHQIGAGSVGPVFRGEDGETREPVVIKVIRVGLPPERVAVVATALASLRERLPAHPALTPLLDTGVVEVEPFIVTPFIDGDSLDVALREFGPANMADALPRLRMLADAMDAAAAVGVAHGSLHLRDIVVSVDDTVLTGMGVAAVLERVGVRPPVRRPYCAPEVALGHGISPAADQYALAAIAHEWLSGRRLAGSGAAGFQVPAVSDAGAEALHAVFARAMSEAPESRYPTATAFVEAIAELAGQAAPRSKTNRRPAVVETPRLSFDEPADDIEPPEDEAAADDDVTPAAGVIDAPDPLDTPLLLTPSPAAIAWEPEVELPAAPRHFASLDDDAPETDAEDDPDDRPVATAQAWDGVAEDEPRADTADMPRDETAPVDSPSGAWTTWAALILVATAAALAGGWALLRWGTPSSAVVSTATTGAAETPADAGAPARESAAPAGAPLAVEPAPAAPVTESAAPVSTPTPSDAATPAVAPPAASQVARSAPSAAAPPPAAPRPADTPPPAARPAAKPPSRPAPRAVSPAPAPAPGRAAAARQAARPAAAAVAGGRLLVRSSPGGAEVFVNGERRGVTPLALRDLPYGAYAVRVVRAGFAPVEQRVAIDAGRPARSLELTLTRGAAPGTAAPAASVPAASGSLLVESRPAGARVFVDGTDIGVTPVTMPSLAAGPHTVRIERAGYASITTSARIEARTRARVAVTLTAERPR